jgi:hypothetical protein
LRSPACPATLSSTKGFLCAQTSWFQCSPQKLWHTQLLCASDLVFGVCGESGHGKSPCPNPLHCINCSGAHTSGDRMCFVFLGKKAIQEVWVIGHLSFLDTQKKLWGTNWDLAIVISSLLPTRNSYA